MAFSKSQAWFWTAGAAVIVTIIAIKLTQFLPAGLYFSFSEGYTSETGAFLVPAPVVNADELCLIERDAGYTFGSCPYYGDEASDDTKVEDIRRAILEKFVLVEAPILAAASKNLSPAEMGTPPLQVAESALNDTRNLDGAIDDLIETYTNYLVWQLGNQLSEQITVPPLPEEAEEDDASSPEADPPVLDRVRAEFTRGVENAQRNLEAGLPITLRRLTPQEISAALYTENYAIDYLPNALAEQYAPQIEPTVRALVTDAFADAGFNAAAIRKERDAAVASAAGPAYYAAIGIRLAIPLIVGLLFGFAVKAATKGSVAVGTGAAAFLLVWPVVVLWDTVVSEAYRDLQPLFLVFYVAYVMSFASMGWLGTTLGQQAAARFMQGRRPDKGVVPFKLIRELGVQLGVAAVTNALTIGLSVFVFGSKMSW